MDAHEVRKEITRILLRYRPQRAEPKEEADEIMEVIHRYASERYQAGLADAVADND